MDGSVSILASFFRTILEAAVTVSVLMCVDALASEGNTNMIQFDRMTVGAPPAEFSFARTGRGSDGEWTVVADTSAKAGIAIEQTSTDATDYRFPLAIHDSLSEKNLKAQIRFKAVSGKVDRAAGIAVRIEDPDNYYIARANALEDNVRFYRVVAGKREQLGTANIRVTSGEWHTLTLEADGSRFAVAYDGAMLFEATDNTFTEAGGVGLWTKADSVTRFDMMTITPLP